MAVPAMKDTHSLHQNSTVSVQLDTEPDDEFSLAQLPPSQEQRGLHEASDDQETQSQLRRSTRQRRRPQRFSDYVLTSDKA